MVYAFLAGGLALLVLGSLLAMRGAAGLVGIFGRPPPAIGLLVGALAATLPELFVTLEAVQRGGSAVAIIVGSTIANMFFVLGICALIGLVPTPPRVVFRECGVLLVAGLVICAAFATGGFAKPVGIALLIGAGAYAGLSIVTEWGRPRDAAEDGSTTSSTLRAGPGLFFLIFGLTGIFFGARYAIDGAAATGRFLAMSPALVGLTLLGPGTALPDLFAGVLALHRDNSASIAGQVLAASIFNVLLVLGLAATLHPLGISHPLFVAGVAVMAGGAALLMPLFMVAWRITRAQGILLLICYAAYLACLVGWSGLR
jgi:cation:H+ antiporter